MPSPPSTHRPPPLTVWQHVWRYLAAVTVSTIAMAGAWTATWDASPLWVIGDLAVGLACLVLMAFRRRWPVPIATLVTLAGGFASTAAGPGVVVAVSLATHRKWRQILPIGALGIGMGLVYAAIQPSEGERWYVSLSFNVVFTAVLLATGMYVGARRELMASLHDRAERAEREQALRVAQARANERARIAREMHDVLAHRMSLVAMHAGALAYRTDLSPEQTRDAAGVIQQGANRALADLREVLGLLRDSDLVADGEAPERPQPTLCDVPGLVEEARAAGTRVTLSDDIREPQRAPETAGRNAYRMIQEGLTNARKHAPHTPVAVRLSGAPGAELRVEVRNPLPLQHWPPTPRGGGLGLVGLAERAALSGGRFEHGPTADEFVLRAWLPWPA